MAKVSSAIIFYTEGTCIEKMTSSFSIYSCQQTSLSAPGLTSNKPVHIMCGSVVRGGLCKASMANSGVQQSGRNY